MNPSTLLSGARRRFLLLLFALVAFGLLGAAAPGTPYTTECRVGLGAGSAILSIVEMGGCQYVVARWGSQGLNSASAAVSIVHHAACTNPAHGTTTPAALVVVKPSPSTP